MRPDASITPAEALQLARRNLQRLIDREKARERARAQEAVRAEEPHTLHSLALKYV